MSTKEEQLALLNAEKQTNIDDIAFINVQIEGLNNAIINQNNSINQYNQQITDLNNKSVLLTGNNITLDEIITIVEAS